MTSCGKCSKQFVSDHLWASLISKAKLLLRCGCFVVFIEIYCYTCHFPSWNFGWESYHSTHLIYTWPSFVFFCSFWILKLALNEGILELQIQYHYWVRFYRNLWMNWNSFTLLIIRSACGQWILNYLVNFRPLLRMVSLQTYHQTFFQSKVGDLKCSFQISRWGLNFSFLYIFMLFWEDLVMNLLILHFYPQFFLAWYL